MEIKIHSTRAKVTQVKTSIRVNEQGTGWG